jgi:hypothetical protein
VVLSLFSTSLAPALVKLYTAPGVVLGSSTPVAATFHAGRPVPRSKAGDMAGATRCWMLLLHAPDVVGCANVGCGGHGGGAVMVGGSGARKLGGSGASGGSGGSAEEHRLVSPRLSVARW